MDTANKPARVLKLITSTQSREGRWIASAGVFMAKRALTLIELLTLLE
jgi:hypothetical protein